MNLGVKFGSKFTSEEEGKSRWRRLCGRPGAQTLTMCGITQEQTAIGTTNEDNSYLLLALGSDDPSWLT